jgi:peptide/nickel transport system substrate-binding protein
MRMIRSAAMIAAALTLAAAAAACSSSSNSSGGSAANSAKSGGTVTIAWNATPNFVFPYAPAANTDGYNANLSELIWPYLTYAGDGAQSAVNPQESLWSSITWSNDDKTFTMVLKPWKWSDGAPITSRDFTFVYNLLKANYANWNLYVPGGFPTDVTSVSAPSEHTVVVNLNQSYNPAFYVDNILNTVALMPQHAWDKESVNGPVGNYDQTTAGAKAVYAFLQREGGDITSFVTNPLWKVVDGPFKLSQFQANGTYTYVPNENYSGNKPHLSKVVNLFYTTDVAELDSLRAGGTIDAGNLPLNDLQQSGLLKAEGYSVTPDPLAAFAAIYPNFYNAKVGAVFSQLYMRQAMEDLIDRPELVSKVFDGDADPGNGPVPLTFGSLVSPLERSGGPYPYSPSNAVSLLKAHGWTVVPNGVSTCTSPGSGASDCGAGISAGEQLSFQLEYSSGTATYDQEMAAIQSWDEQAGIKITLKSEPFNTLAGTVGVCNGSSHPASSCGWQLVYFGYEPYYLYPSGTGDFNTDGFNNQGGYSNPEMDNLINQTDHGSSMSTFLQYENFAAEQLPQLWVPDQDIIQVYKSDLGGFAPFNPFSGGINPEDWYYKS